MNSIEVRLLLVFGCLGSGVLGGLLPHSGNDGYQYNRPNGVGFGGLNGVTYNGRPSTTFLAPGYGGFTGPVALGFGNYQGGSGVTGVYRDSSYNGYEDNRPRPYSFQYEVRDPSTSNDYGQKETSFDGNAVVGEYRVLLPDSRTQIVKYVADDAGGYRADVQYLGQAQFPRGIGGGYNAGYQAGFAPSTYQPGSSGPIGGNSGTRIFGGGSNNQYLPPTNTYGK